MPPIEEILRGPGPPGFAVEGLDDDELYLHAPGQHALYEDAGLLAGEDVLTALRKARKVGRQLHEHAVALYAAYHAADGLPGLKAPGVLGPGA